MCSVKTLTHLIMIISILIAQLFLSANTFADNGWHTFNHGINGTGSITAIAFHAAHRSEVYLGVDGSGLYASVDQGVSWKKIADEIFNGEKITGIAFNPKNPEEIFVSIPFGLYRTLNHGHTWQKISTAPSYYITSIAINPIKSEEMYLTTRNRGVYKSINSGATWFSIDDKIPRQFLYGSISINPLNPNQLILFTLDEINILPHLFQSIDGGLNWKHFDIQGASHSAFSPNRFQQIYASSYDGLVRSDDLGNTWSLIFKTRNMINAISINDQQSAEILVSIQNEGVYKTQDAGQHWRLMNTIYKDDQHTNLVMSPSNNFILQTTDDHGVWRSDNAGETWTESNSGVVSLKVTAIAFDPANSHRAYAGTKSHGLWIMNDGKTWTHANKFKDATIDTILVNPTQPSHIVIIVNEEKPNTHQRIYYSDDYGKTWQQAAVNQQEEYEFTPKYIAYHPLNAREMFAVGNQKFWKSNDSGLSWNLISTLDTKDILLRENALVINPKKPEEMYIGVTSYSGRLLYKSIDGGKSWNALYYQFIKDEPVDHFYALHSLMLDPQNPSIIYVGAGNQLYKSLDAGKTWMIINAGLPAIKNISAILFDINQPNILYLGTNNNSENIASNGVFISYDNGKMWTSFNEGLTNLSISNLALNREQLYASTNGPGVFTRKIM